MQPDTRKVQICNYEPKYARSLAEMWNNSTEAWNGHLFNYSEAQILDEELNSTALATYLAIDNDKVVGYINLCRDEADIANVGMLNVLPSYHGAGLGKILLKRCVLKTAELKMPYITLYTWAGNTKAVPLYKKCGFFWQKLEASATYLINFVPGLLSNELVKPYFDYFDWYDDLVRELRVEPDGDEEDDFIFYRYLWQKNGQSLKVVFDKASRSIVEIESQDFHLSTHVFVAKPVFGTKHMVSYTYKCFNPAFKDIEIHSRPEHNISYEFHHQDQAKPAISIEAEYNLLPITKEFSEWEALPAVKTQVLIGGKAITIGNSQKVRYPIQLSLNAKRMLRTDCPQTLYVNLESNLDSSCELKLSFPEQGKLRLLQPELNCVLKAGEKKVMELEIILSGSCFYAPEVQAEFKSENSELMQFCLEPDILLRTLRGTEAGRSKDKAILIAGMNYFQMPLQDQKNWGYLISDTGSFVYCRPSDFGRPFSAEFEREEARDMIFETREDAARMEVFYESKQHPGLKFSKIYTLFVSGEMQMQIRFQAIPEEHETLCLRELVAPPTSGFTFAKNDRLISLAIEMADESPSDFDIKDVTEPWFYFSKDKSNTAIIWEEGWQAGFDHWWFAFDLDLAKLKSMKDMQSPALRFYLDCFASAYQLRDYVLGEFRDKIPKEYSADIVVNKHNPFYDKELELEVVHHQQMGIEGTLQITDPEFSAKAEAGKSYRIELEQEPIALLDAQIAYPAFTIKHPRVLLRKSGTISYFEDEEFLGMDNGRISFKAKKNSALPTIAGLSYNGMEWLDPIPQGFVPRSSFNPYPGGILCVPPSVKAVNFMQDKHILQRAELIDQHANIWSGLSWDTEVGHFEPLKGLRYKHYYLSCPGLPILIVAVEILKDIARANYLSFGVQTHYHPQNVMPKAEFSYPDSNDKWHSFRNSSLMQHHTAQGCISRIRVEDSILHLLSFSTRYWAMSSNKDFMRTNDHCYSKLHPKSGDILSPIVMLFDFRELETEMMQDLLNMKLKRV